MRKLIFASGVYDAINRVVQAVGVETGVRLVGTIHDDRYEVLYVIGPGQNARQAPYHYCCDNQHAETVFNELIERNPELKWLGELHVHPRGFPRLSGTDLRTVRDVILGTDDTLHPEEFIAGVMLRLDRHFTVSPLVFSKQNLRGEPMEVDYGTDICQKPA